MVDNQDKSILYGRLVVYRTEDCHRLTKKASIIPAIDKGYCGRCQSKILMHWQLPGDEKYCWQCANMGRITTKHCLVTIEEPNDFETIVNPCTWP